jgi:hypothetical protein
MLAPIALRGLGGARCRSSWARSTSRPSQLLLVFSASDHVACRFHPAAAACCSGRRAARHHGHHTSFVFHGASLPPIQFLASHPAHHDALLCSSYVNLTAESPPDAAVPASTVGVFRRPLGIHPRIASGHTPVSVSPPALAFLPGYVGPEVRRPACLRIPTRRVARFCRSALEVRRARCRAQMRPGLGQQSPLHRHDSENGPADPWA